MGAKQFTKAEKWSARDRDLKKEIGQEKNKERETEKKGMSIYIDVQNRQKQKSMDSYIS